MVPALRPDNLPKCVSSDSSAKAYQLVSPYLFLLQSLNFSAIKPTPLSCRPLTDFKNARSLIFSWVAFEKMKRHQKSIGAQCFGINVSFGNLRRLEILKNCRIYVWIGSIQCLEALQALRSSYIRLAIVVESTQLETFSQHLVCCKNEHCCSGRDPKRAFSLSRSLSVAVGLSLSLCVGVSLARSRSVSLGFAR